MVPARRRSRSAIKWSLLSTIDSGKKIKSFVGKTDNSSGPPVRCRCLLTTAAEVDSQLTQAMEGYTSDTATTAAA
jgi:hypothetical protein